MKVKSLLETKSREVVSINVNDSVEDTIRLMNSKKISAVLVNDKKRQLGSSPKGTLSDVMFLKAKKNSGTFL